MNIAFHTLGCKVNQYETGLLKEHFSHKGYTIVSDTDFAEIYVINTCTVTGTADKKISKLIRRFKRQNPVAIVAVTGCFPQAFPDDAKALEDADIIVGTKDRLGLINLIENYSKPYFEVSPHKKDDPFEAMTVGAYSDKTRAFVKIQDGCDRYCSYCIIPYARGHVRSKKPQEVISEVIALAEHGHKEVVLVGINLAMYGRDIGTSLVEIAEQLCNISKLERIRLGSTEPVLVSKQDFIRLSKQDKICPHFHIALQSGSDEILKRMGRPYKTDEYMDIINTVRENFLNPAITTDIIVGFPGESDAEFNKTIEFVKKLAPADIHVFPYSKRQGTKAAEMNEQVAEDTKKQRVKILTELADQLKKEFLHSMIGTVQEVLFENTTNSYGRMGHTPNYTCVYVNNPQALKKEIKKVRITAVKEDFCIGELVV